MRLGIDGNLYEALLEGLAASPGAGGGAPPRARASASVVPWRRTPGGGIEVYWVKRGEALPFMGGWHAFPGGGLARSDAEIPVVLPPATTPSAAEPLSTVEAIGDTQRRADQDQGEAAECRGRKTHYGVEDTKTAQNCGHRL